MAASSADAGRMRQEPRRRRGARCATDAKIPGAGARIRPSFGIFAVGKNISHETTPSVVVRADGGGWLQARLPSAYGPLCVCWRASRAAGRRARYGRRGAPLGLCRCRGAACDTLPLCRCGPLQRGACRRADSRRAVGLHRYHGVDGHRPRVCRGFALCRQPGLGRAAGRPARPHRP